MVLFFIDRGNARQPEALSLRSLSLLGLEGPGLRHAASVAGFLSARSIMSVQSRHWLDYDPVALVVLLVGMSAVAFLALSI